MMAYIRLTAHIWFGLIPSPKSFTATSYTQNTMCNKVFTMGDTMKIDLKTKKTEAGWQKAVDDFWLKATPKWFEWLSWVLILGVFTFGDVVLKAVLADLLIKSGCKTSDEITSKKQELESKEPLARISQGLGIGHFITLGAGEKKQKANEEPSVLAGTLEALIGAIYLDGGYDASKNVITKWFKNFFA